MAGFPLRLLILCALVLVSFAATAEARQVRMGVFEVNPLIVKDASGKYGGGVVEVIDYIAAAEGWDIEYVPCKFPVCLQLLGSSEIDLMGSISYNAERAQKYDYTNETFFMDWGVIYVPPGSEISTIVDLEGKKLAVLKNTIQFAPFMEIINSFGINVEIVFVDNYLDVFHQVQNGNADALMVNRIFGERNAAKFDMRKTSIIFSPMDIRYAVPKEKNSEIIKAVDLHLASLKKDEQSIYYEAVNRMFGATAKSFIPAWLWWISAVAGTLLLGSALMSLWLRQMVKVRTIELNEMNLQLIDEVREREHAEEDLRVSEEKYRSFVDTTSEGFWTLDRDNRTLDMNDSLLRMLGYSREEITGKRPEDLATDESRELIFAKRSEIQSTPSRNYELELYRKDGSVIKVIANASTSYDADGEFQGSFAFITDITALKEFQERLEDSIVEKEVLLKEIHHRVKNNMQIISSLLNLQSRMTSDEKVQAYFRETRGRINSMALVHEQLYKTTELSHIDIGEYIETLARHVLKAHKVGSSAVRLNMDVEEFPLDIDLLIPCGIMLNELLTNAVKYGIHGRPDAVISVSFKKSGKSDEYIVVVRDNGPGLPEGFSFESSNTLGVQIVEALVGQLQGDIKWENDEGAKFTIKFSEISEED